MKVEGVELRLLELGLREPIGTAAGTHRRRPVAIVRVLADSAEGWGECGALAEGTAVDPPVAAVWDRLTDVTIPSFVERALRGGVELYAGEGIAAHPPPVQAGAGGAGPVDRFAGAALEMAVVDVGLRESGRSLAQWLGARQPVDAGTLVGIPEGNRDAERLGVLVDRVGEAVAKGFRRVRLKIRPGWDEAPVRAVRERYPDVQLQADANGAYRLGGGGSDDARGLARLDPFALACLEQPLPPDALADAAALAGLLRTPVALDESLWDEGRVERAVAAGACAVACLKPARLGGLAAARRAVGRCRASGVHAFVGGFFEAGLGRSANAALAGLPGFDLAGDLGPPDDYLLDDPFGYPEVSAGSVRLPPGGGIAGVPDARELDRLTVRRQWFPAAPGARRRPASGGADLPSQA